MDIDTKNAPISLMTKQSSSTDDEKLCNDQRNDIITIIWDETDRIHHICNEGEIQFKLETADYEEGNIKWTTLFDVDMVERVQEHFLHSDKTLHLKNVAIQSFIESSRSYTAEITSFTMESKQCYVGYFKSATIDQVYNNLMDNNKLLTSSWLAAGLVHEIRNPLTSLKGFLQLVQAGITQEEEYYHVMISEVEKLEDITNELLLNAKPDKKAKQKETIKQLIDDVVLIMNTQVDLRKIDFNLLIEEGLHIFCKASQIKQVLINVIKNSAEAMDYEGTIQVEAYEENDEVHILIIDEGVGMEAEQIKEIKTPFHTTKSCGTGLGLVITNHILQDHDGDFSLKPNDVDDGMTMTIHLPVVK